MNRIHKRFVIATAATALVAGGTVGAYAVTAEEDAAPLSASAKAAAGDDLAQARKAGQDGIGRMSGGAGAKGSEFHTRTVWDTVNVRDLPSTDSSRIGTLKAGNSYSTLCWGHYQKVKSDGYTNDVWVMVRAGGNKVGWASAIYFKGDEKANLPASNKCSGSPH